MFTLAKLSTNRINDDFVDLAVFCKVRLEKSHRPTQGHLEEATTETAEKVLVPAGKRVRSTTTSGACTAGQSAEHGTSTNAIGQKTVLILEAEEARTVRSATR